MELQTRSGVMMERRVSFKSEVSVVELPASQEEERKRLFWYQREDFLSFHMEQLQTIHALKKAQGDLSYLDPSKHCLRGLERKISAGYGRERRSQQTEIINMVLEAQTEQREKGVRDPEGIKKLSSVFSRVSRDRAVEMAALDAKACHDEQRRKRPSSFENCETSSKRRHGFVCQRRQSSARIGEGQPSKSCLLHKWQNVVFV